MCVSDWSVWRLFHLAFSSFQFSCAPQTLWTCFPRGHGHSLHSESRVLTTQSTRYSVFRPVPGRQPVRRVSYWSRSCNRILRLPLKISVRVFWFFGAFFICLTCFFWLFFAWFFLLGPLAQLARSWTWTFSGYVVYLKAKPKSSKSRKAKATKKKQTTIKTTTTTYW